MHVILEPHAKLSSNIDAGLIAERHAGRQLGRVPADQVGPLVPIHADAVSHAMREELVVRAIARIRMIFRAAASTAPHSTPGRAAASAADCARCTTSKTFLTLSGAEPRTNVRVMSDR